MLIVLCLLIVGGLLTLGRGLQVPHRSDLLLVRLLGKLILSIFTHVPLDLLLWYLAARLMARGCTYLPDHRDGCLFPIQLLVRPSLHLGIRRRRGALEPGRANLRGALVRLVDVLILSILLLLLCLAGRYFLHR